MVHVGLVHPSWCVTQTTYRQRLESEAQCSAQQIVELFTPEAHKQLVLAFEDTKRDGSL